MFPILRLKWYSNFILLFKLACIQEIGVFLMLFNIRFVFCGMSNFFGVFIIGPFPFDNSYSCVILSLQLCIVLSALARTYICNPFILGFLLLILTCYSYFNKYYKSSLRVSYFILLNKFKPVIFVFDKRRKENILIEIEVTNQD